jgi:hypothetical protein
MVSSTPFGCPVEPDGVDDVCEAVRMDLDSLVSFSLRPLSISPMVRIGTDINAEGTFCR